MLEALEAIFPASSHYIQMDTGWRDRGGERVGGWHIEVIGPALHIEVSRASLADAIRECIKRGEAVYGRQAQ